MTLLWQFVREQYGEVAGLIVAVVGLIYSVCMLAALIYLLVALADGDLVVRAYLR